MTRIALYNRALPRRQAAIIVSLKMKNDVMDEKSKKAIIFPAVVMVPSFLFDKNYFLILYPTPPPKPPDCPDE